MEIGMMIRRYETLKNRMNCFSISAPLRLKAITSDEMKSIAKDLNDLGYSLNYFGKWVL